jgi:hypothetical protein
MRGGRDPSLRLKNGGAQDDISKSQGLSDDAFGVVVLEKNYGDGVRHNRLGLMASG